MKAVLRIFNIVFIAISAVAIILLASLPAVSVNVSYKVTAEQISHVIPQSEETKDVDVKAAIGGENISIGISLSVTPKAIFRSVGGSGRTVIDEEFIDPNIKNMINSLRSPIHRIAQGIAKQLAVKVLIQNFEDRIDEYKDSSDSRTATQIRNAAGLDDAYFNNFTDAIFNEMSKDNATLTAVSEVMFVQLQDASTKLNNAGLNIELPPLDDTYKGTVRASAVSMFDELHLLKDDGDSLYSMNNVIDAMIVDVIRAQNQENAAEGETIDDKAALLDATLTDMIKSAFTDSVYDTMILVLKIMLIVLIVIISIWAFFLIWTLLKTVLPGDKVYTFTGPLFWINGVIQIVLGLVLTIATSIIFNGEFMAKMGGDGTMGALKNLSASIVTSCFVPSILVLICLPISIVYGVFKHKYKRELKAAAPKE